ncbi:MAG: D-alanyl-D-alanine carboxypeptidase, partial [Planctomycetes bacterium]|nr:D-alanyl-D-alanine carboxypeptidase [Planctomycetota bacterium]
DSGGGKPIHASWQDSGDLLVRGDLKSSRNIQLAPREHRPMFEAWLLNGLRSRGFVAGSVRWVELDEDFSGDSLLFEYDSLWTVADAVAVTNKDSDNFVAEVLLHTLAAKTESKGWQAGVQAIATTLHDSGWDGSPPDQADGSGLSRSVHEQVNTSTPAEICSLLRFMAHRETGAYFFDSLPIAGVDGRLKTRFQSPEFHPGRVHAKTGFIHGASSLSGYLLVGEEPLVFSVVVNFVRDGKARTNNQRFKELQEDILTEILSSYPEA